MRELELHKSIMNRRGKLYMTDVCFSDHPEMAQVLYSKIIPYRVEFLYDRRVFEIYAYSEHFDYEYTPGEEPPEYRAIFNSLDKRVKFEVTAK